MVLPQGFFEYVINPPGSCGGPPYPGAQVHSVDGCWIFQASEQCLEPMRDIVELTTGKLQIRR